MALFIIILKLIETYNSELMNEKLGIVIPTYERSEILKENFVLMLEEIQKYSIPIFISDDSKDLKTEEWANELRLTYPYINYFNNSPNLGHDKNLIQSIMIPNTDYVWLLGDSMIIKKGAISKILQIINKNKSDIIAFNTKNRDISFVSNSYSDHNEILSNFGWHLTMTGNRLFEKSYFLCNQKWISINIRIFHNFP